MQSYDGETGEPFCGEGTVSPREIINTHDQLCAFGGDRIAILFSAQISGRACRSANYSVYRVVDGKELITDPKAHWRDYGHKAFDVCGGRETKPAVLAEAIAWANAKYGEREFVRNRVGDYVEREVNERFPIPPRSRKAKAVPAPLVDTPSSPAEREQ